MTIIILQYTFTKLYCYSEIQRVDGQVSIPISASEKCFDYNAEVQMYANK